MGRTVIRTNRRLSEVRRLVRDLPQILAGSKPDVLGVRRAFWSGVANSMYQDIEVAFDKKANLETDELGERWEDLKPATKAYARKARENDLSKRERNNLRNGRTIGLLDYNQTKIWKSIFARVRAQKMRAGLSLAQANVEAGQVAWAEIKKLGGQTKIQRLGFRKLQVLKDKKALYRSLRRGSFNGVEYRPAGGNQIFKIDRDRLQLGTRDKKAARHHNGDPSHNLPARRLWARNIQPWLRRANTAGVKACVIQLTRSI